MLETEINLFVSFLNLNLVMESQGLSHKELSIRVNVRQVLEKQLRALAVDSMRIIE